MKKLIAICGLLTVTSAVTFAQSKQTAPSATPAQPSMQLAPQPTPQRAVPAAQQRQQVTPEMIAERRAKMYQAQYKLTDDQYKGVYNAELEYMKEHEKLRASGTQANQQQMQQMEMAKDQKFKAAMNEDQYKRYQMTSGRRGTPLTPATQPQATPEVRPNATPATK